MFSGSIVAIITPFHSGKLDEAALQDLVSWHIGEGTDGIVCCGTTGEALLLSSEERHKVITLTLKAAENRIPVIVGCSAAGTLETIKMVQEAQDAGAAAALIVTPYYIKPTSLGLYQHFLEIHEKTNLPIIIYNNPGRTSGEISVETLSKLAELPRIVGYKESGSDLTRPVFLRQTIKKDFCILSGDDPTAPAYFTYGADGWCSVAGNVAPKLCKALVQAWKNKDIDLFRELTDLLTPLNLSMFVETNPGPVKCAVSLLGKCHNELRLPLVPVSSQTETCVKEAMAYAKLLS